MNFSDYSDIRDVFFDLKLDLIKVDDCSYCIEHSLLLVKLRCEEDAKPLQTPKTAESQEGSNRFAVSSLNDEAKFAKMRREPGFLRVKEKDISTHKLKKLPRSKLNLKEWGGRRIEWIIL